jgi:O-antigen ligase
MDGMVTNISASLESSARFTNIGRGDIVRLALFVLLGSLTILHPLFVLGCLAAAATLGICWRIVVHVRRAGLELWQVLLLIALTGYMVLNYGFENVTIHVGGFPIIISYGLMYASLALAVSCHWPLVSRALKEPAMLCVLALLVLAFLHLAVDIPSYGFWAIRDSSICLDGIFLILGLLWAMKRNSTFFLTKWLIVVFALNLIYSFTLPWGEKLWSWSPQSGVFLQGPVLGTFSGTGDILASGAVFCICLGGYVARRPRGMMLFLAMAQLLGVAIAQTRRMYVGIVVVLIILVLLGETKKYAKLLILLSSAIMVLFLLTTVVGLEISGRVGPVNIAFSRELIRSISGAEGTPGSSVQTRFDFADEAFVHVRAHPVLGEGFGQPLLNNNDTTGPDVRQPHNSSLSMLARMGTIGFAIWMAFHLCLTKRFIYALRRRRCCDKRLSDLVLWFFLFYVLVMIASFVEAPFEFPSMAVPFYFLVGVALGLIRWQLPQTNRIDH